MKLLGRSILGVLTAVSLVLCIATVALWVRSYWVCDAVALRYIPQDLSYSELAALVSSRGGLCFQSNF